MGEKIIFYEKRYALYKGFTYQKTTQLEVPSFYSWRSKHRTLKKQR